MGQFESESKSVGKITVGLKTKFFPKNISTVRFESYLLTLSYLSAKECCKTCFFFFNFPINTTRNVDQQKLFT